MEEPLKRDQGQQETERHACCSSINGSPAVTQLDVAVALTWVARVWEMHLRLDQHALGRDGSRAVAVGVDWSLVRH